ncbi:MAG: hypothetical protein ACREM2_07555, partial [Vulcanimicrobiaceae bacterium]
AAVSIFVIDVLGEERARRRRVASLAPRLAVAVVPTIWIASAAAAALLTIPYVVLAEERAAAAIVGICSLVMAYIAWRIASAPVQLAGEDIAAERGRDRAIRLRRVGLTTVVAIGNVFVFTSFVNAELPFVTTAQRAVHMTSLAAWVALWAWQAWYVRRLGRGSYAACA